MPDILLLDEPTSALDLHTEAQVIREFTKLRNQTLIIATHRPGLLETVDRIISIN